MKSARTSRFGVRSAWMLGPCVSIRAQPHVEQRVGLAHAVALGAPDHLKAHALVEAERLAILLIHVEARGAESSDGVRQQTAPDAAPTPVWMDEEHLDLVARDADVARNLARIIAHAEQVIDFGQVLAHQ